jgi:hypothetical protein
MSCNLQPDAGLIKNSANVMHNRWAITKIKQLPPPLLGGTWHLTYIEHCYAGQNLNQLKDRYRLLPCRMQEPFCLQPQRGKDFCNSRKGPCNKDMAGEEVILFIDVNKNVYMGPLAKALQGNRLRMEEQTHHSTGKEAPHSYCTRKVAIVGTYATLGMICTNSYLSPHGAGVGNLRFQVHNFDAHTVLSTDYPKIVCPHRRALLCGVEQTVKQYNKVVRQLLIRHQSFEKLDFLQSNHHLMSVGDFQILFNKWDIEVTQLMLALEKWYNKFCDRSIEVMSTGTIFFT